jgi:uncharacterized caspase-like protein
VLGAFDDPDFYWIVPPRQTRGFALCIGNALRACENDATKMGKALELLGYNVQVLLHASAADIVSAVRTLAMKDHSHSDSVVFFFSGHGQDVSVLGEDKQPVEIKSFITSPLSALNAPSLYGKPRLCFFDCCRGNTFDAQVGRECLCV